MQEILKKLNIKAKPEKILSILFYSLTIFIVLVSILTVLKFMTSSGLPVIDNDTPPYLYAIYFFLPVLAFSYFMNSGMAKNDSQKINMYIVTFILLGSIIGVMFATWINNVAWWLMEMHPSFEKVKATYPELFAPALKTVTMVIPFIGIFKILDYFFDLFKDDYLPSCIAGFKGIKVGNKEKSTGAYSCEVVICKEQGTNLPIIVPEKKRYEATFVQGATGTGKTATVLLPMSAMDLEKKFFFRELSKKLGYSMLKKGIAYMSGPYNNEYVNKHFTLNFLKPKRGMEDEFLSTVKPMIQYIDNAADKIVYRNIGITIVENDGNYISNFVGVAKNFDIPVMSIDPLNVETTLSINPFAIPEPPKVASIIADVLKSMYEDSGGGSPGDPFFTQVTLDAFQNLAILLKEMYPVLNDGEIASLEDMLELLYNFDRVEEMTEEMKKIPELEQKYKLLIAYFERNFYKPSLNINGYEIPGTRGSGRKDTERFLYGAITQLNNLLRHPGLKKALCGKDNILNLDTALEQGAVITACSRKGELGIIQAKAFGMFFILQFQDAVLRRKGNEDSRTPHFLYVDEFPEYINKDMEVMFTLFRKYRCGVTVAVQNLSQLEKGGKGASHYKQTILANTKTQIIFGDTIPEDSEYWSKALGSDKKYDDNTTYDLSSPSITKKTSVAYKEKERAKWYKIQNLGFGAIYYKTKDANGATVWGKGKTSFLDSKYKEKHESLMYNFEKYMMSKPDNPTIYMNDSDDVDNDDKLFSVNTTTKLAEELKSIHEDALKSESSNYSLNDSSILGDDFEIELFDEPTLQDSSIDGGAITESYETPAIKKNKK